jgi:hypothetical protein
MPREIRRIFMNAIDLTHALESYRANKPHFLPNGKLAHIEVLEDHLLIKIEMKYLDNVHVLEFNIGYDKLVEVLVAFCLERRIPMPAGSRKTAFAEEGEVVLEVAAANEEAVASRTGELTRWRDRVGL